MIPVLYEPNEENFTTNGVGLLVDAISCVVTEERNGAFELVLKYPAKSLLSKYISEDCIIKAKPNDTDEAQLFRIYGRSKPVKGTITWKAEHVSYELNGYPVNKVKITGKNAAEAISQLLEGAVIENNYTAWSDITTRNNTEIDEVLSVRKALGGVEGSILDVWGGEYRFNNYRVELWKARGKDNGVQIRYGKNMLDGQQEKNISNVVTAVFPYAYYTPEKAEGATETPEPVFVSLPEKIIKTPNVDKYARIKCEPVDFSDKFEDVVITEAVLRKVAAEYAVSGIDEPEVSIKTTFAALHQTKEYANIKELEKVGLCDIVTVIFEDLDTAVKAKIVKYSYDVLKERFESTEIGSVRSNLTKEISKKQSETEKTIIKTLTRAEKIQKEIENTILNITAAITGNSGGHVVLYPAENPQEIFIMDTDDTATAKNVWRWNLAGLGHSSNGIGGPFTTAITADGNIVADFIKVGELSGLLLKAGTVKAEALDILYKQSVTKYADDTAKAAGEAAVEESVTKIAAAKGEIELQIKNVIYENKHNYILNGSGAAGFENWKQSNTTYVTTGSYLEKDCFILDEPTTASSYIYQTLMNVKPGKYTIRFKAATNQGSEDTARIQYTFTTTTFTPLKTIKSDEWTTYESEVEITEEVNRNLYLHNSRQGTTIYLTDIEILGDYTQYADAKFLMQQNEISMKVSENDLESIFEQKAGLIRLQASTITWKSDNSTMTEAGDFTCNSGAIGGWTIESNNISISNTSKRLKLDNTGFEATAITKVGSKTYEQRAKQSAGSLAFAVNNASTLILGALYDGSGNGLTGFNVYKEMVFVPGGGGSTAFRYGGLAGSGSYGAPFYFGNNVKVAAAFSCTGTKSREAETQNYGERLLYSFETPSPMFGDIGTGRTDETGTCYIAIDDIFAETINPDNEYFVFLQKEGKGDLWIEEKTNNYFVVKGTENLKFTWEIKAVQKHFEDLRLDDPNIPKIEDIESGVGENDTTDTIDYSQVGIETVEEYLKEMESVTHVEKNN